jgi:hypothetical protein
MSWDALDFLAAAGLIGATALALVLLFRLGRAPAYRLAATTAVVGCLALVWVNLAVGLVGSAANDFNMLYAFVPLLGLLGTLISRASARGLGLTAAGMAILMVSLLAAAIVTQPDAFSAPGTGLHILFIAVFAFSAWQFQRAHRA